MKNRINFAIKSWKGKRPINQDALACSFNKRNDFCAIVCDGVGSVKGSEHASEIVANTFTDAFEKTNEIESPTAWFRQTLSEAINKLDSFGKKNHCPSIATTIALLIVIDKKFYCYNIGDTRIYKILKHKRTHEVKQCSYDHNYKNYLMSKNVSDEELELNRGRWYAITNYIDASNPSVARFEANSGKITQKTYFLVCTDGLYAYVRDNDKYELINRIHLPLDLRLSLLNKKAMSNGSDDNISGILVSVK